MITRKFTTFSFFLLLAMALGPLQGFTFMAQAQDTSHFFPETGETVSGRFLEYWNQKGGLAQQGFPISDLIQEKSDTDGKTYATQYFERAVFELHAEHAAPNDVLLSLLGVFQYKRNYPTERLTKRPTPNRVPSTFPRPTTPWAVNSSPTGTITAASHSKATLSQTSSRRKVV